MDNDPLRKALDDICTLSEEASKSTRANEKQYFIYQIMLEYCKAFEMPEKEIMEDIPKGTKTKGE